ncbi:MAG: response regulator [Candidatus Marinimicrobia bacterium]|nr:response regulator [Candidatus Neomarinimicrobiota bacterium]MBT3633699.1 response regulator [Candidatus Neomarinimicrobiota bacterium]MBT3682348.1 response regulator [Candidatus Neomarinimicrobiota bacterium]MBT3759112.1 response regulator [Candidatus Neomarinimicrobiota bacterium]MBT3895615.1 response regulator [Candidatus Neomarinimicrobiota bacterium]
MENKRILVVDDEKLIVEYVSMGLEMEGYEVISFTEPKKAVEYLRNNPIDLVLTDLKMPEISGLDIVQVVSESQVDAEVIIFTGYASLDSAIEAVRENVYDYVQKPLELKDLILTIKRALDTQAVRRENKRLNQKIQTMFEQISMLYEISRIIYQIDDKELIFKFVIDTIREGMGLKNTGVFILDEGQYLLVSQSILPQEMISEFKFKVDDTINSMSVSDTEPTIISKLNEKISINQKVITLDDHFTDLHLFPIRFLDRLIGFLVVLSTKNEAVADEESKLMQILTTQIAPIFYRFIGNKTGKSGVKSSRFALEERLEEELYRAIGNNNPISLSVLEISNVSSTILTEKLSMIHDEMKNVIMSHLGKNVYYLWVAPFLLFLIIPNNDKISSELDIIEMIRDFKNRKSDQLEFERMNIFFSTVDCQQDGITTHSLLHQLWKKFLPLREQERLESIADE